MGQLANLYAAIAGMSPTFTYQGHSCTVCQPADAAGLPGSLNGGDLPVRILIPLGAEADAKQGQFLGMGRALKMVWSVPDLMLLQPSNEGAGLADYASALLAYCDAYSDLIQTMRFYGTVAQTVLIGFSLSPGVYEWPLGSGQKYAGVLALLEYEEVLS